MKMPARQAARIAAREHGGIMWIFTGEWSFLDNFYRHEMKVEDWWGMEHIAPTVEHAYQAAKATTFDDYFHVMSADHPGIAKQRGRRLKVIREDWDEVKFVVMRQLLEIKFTDPELTEGLLLSRLVNIVEGNRWHDNIWGDCGCWECRDIPGQNHLGRMLMEIRQVKRDERHRRNVEYKLENRLGNYRRI